jgi:hypothetical protein
MGLIEFFKASCFEVMLKRGKSPSNKAKLIPKHNIPQLKA